MLHALFNISNFSKRCLRHFAN